MARTYFSKKVTVTAGYHIVTGFAEDSFVSLSLEQMVKSQEASPPTHDVPSKFRCCRQVHPMIILCGVTRWTKPMATALSRC